MAMKAVLDSLDTVSDELKGHYKEVDGKFVLQVEGGEDTGALKRAKEHEKERARTAEGKQRDAEATRDALQEEIDNIRKGSVPKTDVDALELSMKNRYEAKLTEKDTAAATLTKQLNTLLVTNKAHELAAKIVASPDYIDVIMPHITRALALDTVDGVAVTRVLDAEGRPTADTLDDLEKRLLQNKAFATILRGSQASGSGASGGGGGGGASKKLSEMSEKERTDLAKSDPQKFQRLVEENRAAAKK
jgi:hypothetical protein